MGQCIVCKKKGGTGGGCGGTASYPRGWKHHNSASIGDGESSEYISGVRTCSKCSKLPEDTILEARLGEEVEEQVVVVKNVLDELAEDRTRLRRLKAARKRAHARSVKAHAIRRAHVPSRKKKKK